MRRADPVARTVLRSYREVGTRARLHTAVRWATCPFPGVESLVPARGRVLDFGCGHGLLTMYLARRSPARDLLGVDIDGAKVTVARRVVTRAGLGGRIELRVVDGDWLPEPDAYDAVVLTDVLYLLGSDGAERLLTAVAASLRPGGVAVVKEMGPTPRWKAAWNQWQETLATRVVRVTAGATLEVLDPDDIARPLREAGLDVVRYEMHEGYLHPHLAIAARRPADAA